MSRPGSRFDVLRALEAPEEHLEFVKIANPRAVQLAMIVVSVVQFIDADDTPPLADLDKYLHESFDQRFDRRLALRADAEKFNDGVLSSSLSFNKAKKWIKKLEVERRRIKYADEHAVDDRPFHRTLFDPAAAFDDPAAYLEARQKDSPKDELLLEIAKFVITVASIKIDAEGMPADSMLQHLNAASPGIERTAARVSEMIDNGVAKDVFDAVAMRAYHEALIGYHRARETPVAIHARAERLIAMFVPPADKDLLDVATFKCTDAATEWVDFARVYTDRFPPPGEEMSSAHARARRVFFSGYKSYLLALMDVVDIKLPLGALVGRRNAISGWHKKVAAEEMPTEGSAIRAAERKAVKAFPPAVDELGKGAKGAWGAAFNAALAALARLRVERVELLQHILNPATGAPEKTKEGAEHELADAKLDICGTLE